MRYNVFAIRDRAADVFGQPIFLASVGIAVRSFADEVNRADANNNLNKHPEDFDLYKLAEFDDDTGLFTQDGPPKQVAVGKDLVR